MKMKLYHIVPRIGQEVLISAFKENDAVVIYITHRENRGLDADEFSLERYDARITGDWRPGMVEMLSKGLPGIATYSEAIGWSVRQL